MINQLDILDEDGKTILTFEEPNKEGEIPILYYDCFGGDTVFLNKDEVLSVIKFLTKYL